MDSVVELRAGCKSLGAVNVLERISLTVGHGESVAITGRSGSGKTTLLALLGLLTTLDSGALVFDGVDLANAPERQRRRARQERLGFVFQNSLLIPHLTCMQNVLAPSLQQSRATARARAAYAQELLGMLAIDHLAHRAPTAISGGERQRFAVARALVHRPALVLADEPTGALDERTGDAVLGILLDLVELQGSSLVLVTHDRSIAERTDRTLSLHRGRLEPLTPERRR